MKKIIILLFLFSCSTCEIFAQDKVSNFYETTYPAVLELYVESPVAASLFSFKDFSLRHSTGQVDIQIPIQGLTLNTLSILIILQELKFKIILGLSVMVGL